MAARQTNAKKEASSLSHLVAILQNHLISERNTRPDAAPYTDTSLTARDWIHCFGAGSHNASHALRCIPKWIEHHKPGLPARCSHEVQRFPAVPPHGHNRCHFRLKGGTLQDFPDHPRQHESLYSARLWCGQLPYLPFFPPPLALSCTFIQVESMLRFSMSSSPESV